MLRAIQKYFSEVKPDDELRMNTFRHKPGKLEICFSHDRLLFAAVRSIYGAEPMLYFKSLYCKGIHIGFVYKNKAILFTTQEPA